MELNKKKFGEMLRKERRKQKMTMQEVGDKVGVTREMVRQYELGRTLPSRQRMKDILELLGISNARLFECSYDNEDFQLISENEFRAVANDSLQYMSTEFLNTQYDLALVMDFIDAFQQKLFERSR